MAFSWGGSKKQQEEAKKKAEQEEEAKKKKKKGKGGSYKIETTIVSPKVKHQTYLDTPSGAKVMYTNCYCEGYSSDHSRGTYDPP